MANDDVGSDGLPLRQPQIDHAADDTSVTMATFSQLMTDDPVFVDYFNVFLSLPVFAERVIYLRMEDRFEFTPPVTSPDRVPDKYRMMSWLYGERMPLFVRSELFAECVLCRRLLEHSTSGAPSRPEQEPTPTFTKSRRSNAVGDIMVVIGGVSRMRNFRRYLADGPGRKLYDLWMDAERFFRIPATDERSRWLKYREIQITFSEFQAPTMATTTTSRWHDHITKTMNNCVLLDNNDNFPGRLSFGAVGVHLPPTTAATGYETVHSGQLIDSMRVGEQSDVKGAVSAVPQLRTVQRLLLVRLADYWLVKYAVHHDARRRIGTAVDGSWPTGNGVGGGGGNVDEAVSMTKLVVRPVIPSVPVQNMVRYARKSDEDVGQHSADVFHGVREVLSASRPVFPAFASPMSSVAKPRLTNSTIGCRLDTSHQRLPSPPTVTSSTSISIGSWPPSLPTLPPGNSDPVKSPFSSVARDQAERSRRREPKFSNCQQFQCNCGRCTESSERVHIDQVRRLIPWETAAQLTSPDLAIERAGRKNAGPEYHFRCTLSKPIEGRDLSSAELRPLCRLSIVSDVDFSIRKCGESQSCGTGVFSPHHRTNKKSHHLSVDHSIVNRQNHDDYVRAVAADRAAGGPFESFLVERDCVEAKRILNFWSDAQTWLSTRVARDTNVQSSISARRARAMMVSYLTGSGDRRTCFFAPALRYSLQRHLAIDKGDNLVRDAQVLAVEYLRPWWDAFCQHDITNGCRALVSASTPSLRENRSFDEMLSHTKVQPKPYRYVISSPGASTERGTADEARSSYSARRRCEIAFQLALEVINFCLDGLPPCCSEGEFDKCIIEDGGDSDYGSLTVKPLLITRRSDLAVDIPRRSRRSEEVCRGKDPQAASDTWRRRQSTLPTLYSKHFIGENGKLFERPKRPRDWTEVINSEAHRELLRQYLVTQKGDATWNLYRELDDFKSASKPCDRQRKRESIIQKYLATKKSTAELYYDATMLEQVIKPEMVDVILLNAVHDVIGENVRDRWFEKYQNIFSNDDAINKLNKNVIPPIRDVTASSLIDSGSAVMNNLLAGNQSTFQERQVLGTVESGTTKDDITGIAEGLDEDQAMVILSHIMEDVGEERRVEVGSDGKTQVEQRIKDFHDAAAQDNIDDGDGERRMKRHDRNVAVEEQYDNLTHTKEIDRITEHFNENVGRKNGIGQQIENPATIVAIQHESDEERRSTQDVDDLATLDGHEDGNDLANRTRKNNVDGLKEVDDLQEAETKRTQQQNVNDASSDDSATREKKTRQKEDKVLELHGEDYGMLRIQESVKSDEVIGSFEHGTVDSVKKTLQTQLDVTKTTDGKDYDDENRESISNGINVEGKRQHIEEHGGSQATLHDDGSLTGKKRTYNMEVGNIEEQDDNGKYLEAKFKPVRLHLKEMLEPATGKNAEQSTKMDTMVDGISISDDYDDSLKKRNERTQKPQNHNIDKAADFFNDNISTSKNSTQEKVDGLNVTGSSGTSAVDAHRTNSRQTWENLIRLQDRNVDTHVTVESNTQKSDIFVVPDLSDNISRAENLKTTVAKSIGNEVHTGRKMKKNIGSSDDSFIVDGLMDERRKVTNHVEPIEDEYRYGDRAIKIGKTNEDKLELRDETVTNITPKTKGDRTADQDEAINKFETNKSNKNVIRAPEIRDDNSIKILDRIRDRKVADLATRGGDSAAKKIQAQRKVVDEIAQLDDDGRVEKLLSIQRNKVDDGVHNLHKFNNFMPTKSGAQKTNTVGSDMAVEYTVDERKHTHAIKVEETRKVIGINDSDSTTGTNKLQKITYDQVADSYRDDNVTVKTVDRKRVDDVGSTRTNRRQVETNLYDENKSDENKKSSSEWKSQKNKFDDSHIPGRTYNENGKEPIDSSITIIVNHVVQTKRTHDNKISLGEGSFMADNSIGRKLFEPIDQDNRDGNENQREITSVDENKEMQDSTGTQDLLKKRDSGMKDKDDALNNVKTNTKGKNFGKVEEASDVSKMNMLGRSGKMQIASKEDSLSDDNTQKIKGQREVANEVLDLHVDSGVGKMGPVRKAKVDRMNEFNKVTMTKGVPKDRTDGDKESVINYEGERRKRKIQQLDGGGLTERGLTSKPQKKDEDMEVKHDIDDERVRRSQTKGIGEPYENVNNAKYKKSEMKAVKVVEELDRNGTKSAGITRAPSNVSEVSEPARVNDDNWKNRTDLPGSINENDGNKGNKDRNQKNMYVDGRVSFLNSDANVMAMKGNYIKKIADVRGIDNDDNNHATDERVASTSYSGSKEKGRKMGRGSELFNCEALHSDRCNLPSVAGRTSFGFGHKQTQKNAVLKGKTRISSQTNKLWMKFIRSVISLRRGLLNADLLVDFLAWVKDTTDTEMKAADGKGHAGTFFEIIGGVRVDLRNIVNDIEFMVEAERYRAAVDDRIRRIVSGTFRPEDNEEIHERGRAIAKRFFVSLNGSNLKVNVTSDMARCVVAMSNSGVARAELVHGPTIQVYAVVDHWWRRFKAFRMKRLDDLLRKDNWKWKPDPVEQISSAAVISVMRQREYFKAEKFLVGVRCLVPGDYYVYYQAPNSTPDFTATQPITTTPGGRCGVKLDNRNKVEDSGPLASFYDRLQARNHTRTFRERDAVLRHLTDKVRDSRPSGGTVVTARTSLHERSATDHSSTTKSEEPTANEVPTLSADSYVVCVIDGITYIKNPQAEVINRGYKSK